MSERHYLCDDGDCPLGSQGMTDCRNFCGRDEDEEDTDE